MKTRKTHKSFDLFSNNNYYIPGFNIEFFYIILLFILGTILASIITVIMQGMGAKYIEIISYPIIFIPTLFYASVKNKKNQFFDKGYKLDSNNFGPYSFAYLSLIVAVITLATSNIMDLTNYILPPMPEFLEKTFESLLTGQPLIVSFILVSIFAPLFEEWLCRGLILRGMLKNGMKPACAIIISALFFAIIHMNPWQAIPAFALGSLFGYVYYKTGSLKLVMLMHLTNNTFSLILSQIPAIKDMKTMMDILGNDIYAYAAYLVISIIVLIFAIQPLRKIPLLSSSGNIDKVEEFKPYL